MRLGRRYGNAEAEAADNADRVVLVMSVDTIAGNASPAGPAGGPPLRWNSRIGIWRRSGNCPTLW